MTETQPRKKPGPRPGAPQKPAQTREERDQRDYLIFQRFVAGLSEWDIARSMNLTGPRVHQIIKKQLAEGARHRQLLTDEMLSIYQTRLETCIKAIWPKVLQQDVKAIDTARRLLQQEATLYNVQGGRLGAMPPEIAQELLGDDNLANLDELTKFRLRRGTGAQ